MLYRASFLTLLVTVASALPADIVPKGWPLGSVTCGSAVYSLSQVMSATNHGASLQSRPVDTYPHEFENFEGLKMWCTGESNFNEFPILRSGLYNGGSPGADRVVFADDGTYCAVITHTGTSGNSFVSCQGD